MRAWYALVCAAALSLAGFGCAKDSSGADSESTTGTCPVGGLGCGCTEGGACDAGLVCEGGLCTNPGEASTSGSTGAATGSTGSAGSTSTSGGSDYCEEPPPVIPCDPPAGSCDITVQDCPAGQKCNPFWDGMAWTGAECVPVQGTAGPGDPCEYLGGATDNCGAGSVCADGAVCVELCGCSAGNFSCNSPTAMCNSAGSLLGICGEMCHPSNPGQCGDELCGLEYSPEAMFSCHPPLLPLASEGEPCEFSNSCEDGLACWSNAMLPSCTDVYCCTPFCDLEAPDCPQGKECLPPTLPLGDCYSNVGVCGVP